MTNIFEENKPKEEGTPAVKPDEGVSGTDTYLGLILNEEANRSTRQQRKL